MTLTDAEKYRKLILIKLAPFVDIYGEPKVVEDWYSPGVHAICWDGPYEWTMLVSDMEYQSRCPNTGIHLQKVIVPASLHHVFAEPYDGSVLVLYFNG